MEQHHDLAEVQQALTDQAADSWRLISAITDRIYGTAPRPTQPGVAALPRVETLTSPNWDQELTRFEQDVSRWEKGHRQAQEEYQRALQSWKILKADIEEYNLMYRESRDLLRSQLYDEGATRMGSRRAPGTGGEPQTTPPVGSGNPNH